MADKCAIADREDAIAYDVALLLRNDSANARAADFRNRLKTIVPARDSGSDEARYGRLESDVAELDALNELTRFSFIVDGMLFDPSNSRWVS